MAADIYSKAGADARFLANTPEGRQALASSPEVTSTIAEQIAAIGPAAGSSVLPAAAITLWGESTTAPAQLAQQVAEYTGLAVNGRGVSGQGGSDVMLRMGVFQPRVTLAGGQIPATGAASITAIDPATGWRRTSGNSSYTFAGTLAGVPGILRNAFAGNANVFTFERSAPGEAVAVPAGTPFIIDPSIPRRDERAVIWTGRNNVAAGDLNVIDELLRIAPEALTSQAKDVLVVGVLNGTNEPRGSAAYNAIARSNARRAAFAGSRFLDIRRDFIDRGLQIAGIIPSTADSQNIAADAPPPSLMADTIHPNADGIKVVAYLYAEKLYELGWTNTLNLPPIPPTHPDALNLIDWHAAYWAEDPDWAHPANNAAITTMRDGTGGGRTLGQIGTTLLPIYVESVAALNGKPALLFDSQRVAVHDYIGELPQPWSIVLILAPTNVTPNSMVVGINEANNGAGVSHRSVGWRLQAATSTAIVSTLQPTAAKHLATYVAKGATSEIEIDGASVVQGNAGAFGINHISLGAGSTKEGALAQTIQGHVAFMGIFPGDVRQAPLWADFEAWVAEHYAITLS